MMKLKLLFLSILFFVDLTFSQEIKIPIDTLVITQHATTIKGQKMNYIAEAGMQPVWNKQGKPIATLFYTYYKRKGIKSTANRPLLFSFNGGPGSGSLWMHLGYTGPKRLKIDDEGYPIQPYGYENNPYSILDVADIVFVNPVNTGYSRIVSYKGKREKRETFFGINQDIKYLAAWVGTFVSRKQRWESPKYLIGESYGGTRVMGLSLALQNKQWMYLNGVIMVSPADYKTFRDNDPISSALNLPYYTATAWYHKKLSSDLQSKKLEEILPECEQFTINKLLPAIVKGGFIDAKEKEDISQRMAYYSGIDKQKIMDSNLELTTSYFWKELLRKEGKIIGRLDSRYIGIDRKNIGEDVDYSPELTSWNHSFAPAINHYIRKELHFTTDIQYNLFGSVHPWNNQKNNVRDDLRKAMAQNPFLKILTQSGYFDGATTYFSAKYSMWQIDPSGKMKNRMYFKTYKGGHMMYLRKEDLQKSTDDLRDFIIKTKTNGKPAKY